MEKPSIAKTRLVLDTDWISAVMAIGGFVICGFLAALNFTRIAHGIPASIRVTWETWTLPAFGVWFFLATKDRRIRTVVALLTLEVVSKIVCWMSRASATVQLTNAAIIRIVDTILFVVACLYAVWWLYSKVRYL